MTTIFRTYSLGVSTNRDAVVYDFDAKRLAQRVEQFAENYNAELNRWQKKGRPDDVDNFVNYEKLKWSRNLKRWFRQEEELKFDANDIRDSAYRPFTRLKLHFARMFVDEVGTSETLVPNKKAAGENKILCANVTVERPFCCLMTNFIPNLVYTGGFGCATYALSLFTYSEDGKERRDNITSKALTLFQIFYDDDSITRENIFHYIYALLHHPAYRNRFAENLKRELPRIPFVGVGRVAPRAPSPAKSPDGAHGVTRPTFYPLSAIEKMKGDAEPVHNPKASAKLFHAFADVGKKLADLHVNYESAEEYKLERIENKEAKLDWRVETMKLSKDKTSLFYNDFLTLSGIPAETFHYRLGNRSALEWVIDQYRVAKDEQGNLTSDPNRMEDEEYIVRLIGQVITVSLETQKLISTLPEITFE
ncbi:MAG: type ISP restriction/modification enzyme [Limisphaerales bacterium]